MSKEVIFFKDTRWHIAFIIKNYADSDNVDLVFYCPVTHLWQEAINVPFGARNNSPYYMRD